MINIMNDISNQKEELDCPECGAKFEVTLKQIADESKVICSCGQSIQLKDKDHSAKKAIEDINKALDDLDNIF